MLLHDHHLPVELLSAGDVDNLAWFGMRSCVVVPGRATRRARSTAELVGDFERLHRTASTLLASAGIRAGFLFGVRPERRPDRYFEDVFREIGAWARAGVLDGVGPVDLGAAGPAPTGARGASDAPTADGARVRAHLDVACEAGVPIQLHAGARMKPSELCRWLRWIDAVAPAARVHVAVASVGQFHAVRRGTWLDVGAWDRTGRAPSPDRPSAPPCAGRVLPTVSLSIGAGAFPVKRAGELLRRLASASPSASSVEAPARLYLGTSLDATHVDVTGLARAWDALERAGYEPLDWLASPGANPPD